MRIHAQPRPDGRWDGVVEFEPDAGGESVTTGSETTQRTADEVFVKSGRYGICRECKEAISAIRLDAVPEAPFCVPCQESFE